MGKEIDIYIHHTIEGEGGGTVGVDTSSIGAEDATEKQKRVTKTAADGMGIAKLVGVQIGKKALQYATSNYGNLTGDYITQTHITEGLEIGGYVGMIAARPLLGTIAVATTVGIKAVNRAIEVRKSEQEAIVLRERVGDIISSGGRR